MTTDRATCRHVYWDLGYCIDCGIHSNDPEYARQCRERSALAQVKPLTYGGHECLDDSPPWFTGRWRDWHRGHGCRKDDGKPRSPEAQAEIDRRRGLSSQGHGATTGEVYAVDRQAEATTGGTTRASSSPVNGCSPEEETR